MPIYTINGIKPDLLDGNFNILGGVCTSVVDGGDATDSNAKAANS